VCSAGRGSGPVVVTPTDLGVGDVVDFWRVEALDPPHLLRLRAEMKLPGTAWLEFRVRPGEDGRGSVLEQLTRFHPRGLSGRACTGVALLPLHRAGFSSLAPELAREAESTAGRRPRALPRLADPPVNA
jgi:hypothetical protein